MATYLPSNLPPYSNARLTLHGLQVARTITRINGIAYWILPQVLGRI